MRGSNSTMNPFVGTAQDLLRRTDDAYRSCSLILVRAINDGELEELVQNGPQQHCFHPATRYEKFYGNMIAQHGQRRNGTIIIYVPRDGDVSLPNNSGDVTTTSMFQMDTDADWMTCTREFRGPVEVYNIHELDWNGMLEYVRRLKML